VLHRFLIAGEIPLIVQDDLLVLPVTAVVLRVFDADNQAGVRVLSKPLLSVTEAVRRQNMYQRTCNIACNILPP
jgi:hypothetical protein